MTDGAITATAPELDAAHGALSRAAMKRGLEVRDAPELTAAIFRGGERAETARINASELPTKTRGLRAGRYAIVLGLLPDQPALSSIKETLRRYRNQCVIARSYLTPNEALDLQLFLIGPRGSERTNEWRPLALAVERDDRVARKLTWLRPSDEAADEASFADFLKRTFLARPWDQDAVFTMAALDNLNRAAALADTDVPRDTVDEWVRLSLAKEEADTLVDGLVAAWRRRGNP